MVTDAKGGHESLDCTRVGTAKWESMSDEPWMQNLFSSWGFALENQEMHGHVVLFTAIDKDTYGESIYDAASRKAIRHEKRTREMFYENGLPCSFGRLPRCFTQMSTQQTQKIFSACLYS